MKKKVFKAKTKGPSKKCRPKGANQPPRKRITARELIKIILPYSPKKNRAKPMADYSTFYPETNSASASGKSKGCRFVSARMETKKIKKIGKRGKQNQILSWLRTISLRFKEPAHRSTVTKVNPMETS